MWSLQQNRAPKRGKVPVCHQNSNLRSEDGEAAGRFQS
jgi:hypothetical protein